MGTLDSKVLDVSSFCRKLWLTANEYRYIPFNGGPRICIGQQFALTEMAYTITRIFQRYEKIENCMPGPASMRSDIVLQPAEPVLLQFTPVLYEK
jgi:cytochrome P450